MVIVPLSHVVFPAYIYHAGLAYYTCGISSFLQTTTINSTDFSMCINLLESFSLSMIHHIIKQVNVPILAFYFFI